MEGNDLKSMIITATRLGWPIGGFPQSFDHDGKTWVQEHLTKAEDGEIQCGEYQSGDDWLIVANV